MAAPMLLVGDRGMLGRAFRELLTGQVRAWQGFDLPDFDAAEPAQVKALFRQAVERRDQLRRLHQRRRRRGARGRGPARERDRAALAGRGLRGRRHPAGSLQHRLRVSAAQATAPYPTDAPIEPLGAYGRTKAAGEQAVRATGGRHLIVRTSWLYAPWGNNFVRTMARLTRDKPALKVVSDQRGRPTSAEHLAASALALLDRGATGTFHVTDGGECTWYDFTVAIAQALGRTCAIAPCTTAEFPRPAPRPAYSVLELSETEALLGPMPDWRDEPVGCAGAARTAVV